METNDVPVPGGNQPVVEQTYNTPAPVEQTPVQQTPAPVVVPPKPAPKFFEGITLMDVIVGTAVITALGLSIYYFRNCIKNANVEYPQIRADLDALKEKMKENEQPEMRTEF